MRSTDQRLTLLPVRSITSSTQARFNAINTDFVGVMEKVDRDPRVMSLAKGGADVLSRLEAMEDQLGVCPFPLRSLAIRCTVATRRSRTCSRAHTSTRTHTHTHTHTHAPGRCQKALAEFLEQKRSAFSRFYFIGDEVRTSGMPYPARIIVPLKTPTPLQLHPPLHCTQ
jgi:hypothetical protein